VLEIAEDTICPLSELHIATRNPKPLQIKPLTSPERHPTDNDHVPQKYIDRSMSEIDAPTDRSIVAVKKPKEEAEPPHHIEIWGQSIPYEVGNPDGNRYFELIRMWRRIEELEADKKNLLDNLKFTKRVLQDHHTMWSIYLREKHGPSYLESKNLQVSCEAAIGKLEQLSNGQHSFELIPKNHPWKK